MKYKLRISAKFAKDLKIITRRGYDTKRLHFIIEELLKGNPLSPIFKDHPLKGEYKGKRECHVYPNWVLVYEIYKDVLILELCRTGTHSDVFE